MSIFNKLMATVLFFLTVSVFSNANAMIHILIPCEDAPQECTDQQGNK